ncbi:MAG: DUF4175 family protein [Bacteroidota bacterium]
MNGATEQALREVLARLGTLRRREDAGRLQAGLLEAALAGIVISLLGLAAEALFRFGVGLRTVLFWLPAAAAAAVLILRALPPLLRRAGILRGETDIELARRAGRASPRLADRLANALQVLRDRGRPEGYSPQLADAALADARAEVEGVDFRSLTDTAPVRRLLRAAAGVLAGGMLGWILFPGPMGDAALRLFHHSRVFLAPPPFRFLVEPGSREVVKGESVEILVRVEGGRPAAVRLETRPRGQEVSEEQTLRPGRDGAFRTTLASLKITTDYHVEALAVASEEYTLTVTDRPLVRSLRLRLLFPSYTRIPPRDVEENVGDVTAPKGTVVLFSVESSKPLSSARLILGSGASVPLAAAGPAATGRMTLAGDATYSIEVKDTEGLANADPVTYALRAAPDAFPTASIPVPGADVSVAENARLPIVLRVADDFGFSAIRLSHRLEQSRYERAAGEYTSVPIPLPPAGTRELDIPTVWSLEDLHLAPEDVVSYYLEVVDNDEVSGPKSARSRVYTLRLPSLEEVFADLDRTQEEAREGMREALQEAAEARRVLEEVRKDLRTNKQNSTWQEKQRAEELGTRYREAQERVREAAARVQQMLSRMEEGRVLSEETIRKYTELQRLMEEMQTPAFAEALKKLQEAMERVSPEAMRKALEEFTFSEEGFRRSLERTLSLLKRMQVEQKLEEAIRRAGEMEHLQEELQAETGRADSSDGSPLEELRRRQEDIRRRAERLGEELEDLQKRMEEFPQEMPREELEEARREMEQGGLEEDLRESERALGDRNPGRAGESQAGARRKMRSLAGKLRQTQDAMRSQQERQALQALRRALEDLLELSRRQEELKNRVRELEQNAQGFRGNAREQMELLRDLGRVTDEMARLSERSMSITPEMGKAIGDAMRRMEEAMRSLEQRNGGGAGQAQSDAMGSLNEAAGMMQGAMQGLMQGAGGGMGLGGFMQRLEQLSSAQQGINQGTRNPGGLTPAQAGALGRLAAEQGMVRKSLEQLAREAAQAGELSRMLGDLQRTAEEMREVQTDLAEGRVSEETLQKQDRILSRLLDSQRSMRERDYEQRRRAQTGENAARESPPRAGTGERDPAGRLQRDLQKALEEGYARDYQELIRRYFEALEQSSPEPEGEGSPLRERMP